MPARCSIPFGRRPSNSTTIVSVASGTIPRMLATSVAISLSFLTLFPEPLISRAAGLIGSVANILVVWIMLAAPAGRLDSAAGRWALGVFSVVVLLAATLEALGTRRVVWLVGMLVSLALVVIVANRWFSASAPSRRSLTPVVVAGIAAAQVRIEHTPDALIVEVADNGPGGAQPSAGSGLQGLDDRVAAAGGRFDMVSQAGLGTRLRAELPTARVSVAAEGRWSS